MLLIITPRIRIAMSEIEFSFARSSGPGGQNVNKVNTKAVLRWSLARSPSLDEETRARLLARLGHRLTREGEILIASDAYRDQPRNREDCLEKLKRLLASAAFEPKERRETRPTRSSKRRKRVAKGKLSEKKKLRRAPRGED